MVFPLIGLLGCGVSKFLLLGEITKRLLGVVAEPVQELLILTEAFVAHVGILPSVFFALCQS